MNRFEDKSICENKLIISIEAQLKLNARTVRYIGKQTT